MRLATRAKLLLVGLGFGLGASLPACQKRTIDMEGRRCDNGNCAPGYLCDPNTQRCAHPLVADCRPGEGICPSEIKTGDDCSSPGSVLPCVTGVKDCSAGCRSCSGVWGDCSAPTCKPGSVWSCSGCDDDCRVQVLNGEPFCNTAVSPAHCDYRECAGGAVDANSRREDGCECKPTGAETCDGKDNDCNGEVDDGVNCGSGKWCAGEGGCLECNTVDHCGQQCQACGGSTPHCQGATAGCTQCDGRAGECGSGKYCRAGACQACDCPAMFPECLDLGEGSFGCRCNGSSCMAASTSAVVGSCSDDRRTCRFFDNFENEGELVSLCPANEVYSSSWARGAPTSTFGPPEVNGVRCHNSQKCWATGLGGPYNACEKSCVQSPQFNLSGVSGPVELSMWVWYKLEDNSQGFDGVTPMLCLGEGSTYQEVYVTPDEGWDTSAIKLGPGDCSWYPRSRPSNWPDWPGFGQYNGDEPVGWTTKRFYIRRESHPILYQPDFRFRVTMVSDSSVQDAGWYMDDVELLVHQSP